MEKKKNHQKTATTTTTKNHQQKLTKKKEKKNQKTHHQTKQKTQLQIHHSYVALIMTGFFSPLMLCEHNHMVLLLLSVNEVNANQKL